MVIKKQKSVVGKAQAVETRNKENTRGDNKDKMKGKIVINKTTEKKHISGVEVGKGEVESAEMAKTVAKKQRRGADREMAEAFFLSPETVSSRLRQRKDIPSFRRVLLRENDFDRIVGKRLKVFWPDSRKWFAGQIKSFDNKKKLHNVLYDDGDKEQLNLMAERFELEIFPSEAFTLLSRSELTPEIPDNGGGIRETVNEGSHIIDDAETEKTKMKQSMSSRAHPGKKEMGSDGSDASGESAKVDGTEVNDGEPFEKKVKMKRKKASKAAKMGKSKQKIKINNEDEKTLHSDDMEVDVLPEKVDKMKIDGKINMERSEDLGYAKDQTGSDSIQASDGSKKTSEVRSKTKPLTKEEDFKVLEKQKIESREAAGGKMESGDKDISEEGKEVKVQGSESPANKQSENDISFANQEIASDGGPDPKSLDSEPVSDAQKNEEEGEANVECQENPFKKMRTRTKARK